jgi:phenylalanine ammonia-lyase
VEVGSNIWSLLEGSTLAIPYDEKEGEGECNIAEDHGLLRQDRYPLRTAPQFLGPQIEDILQALNTVTLECNSSTY